jgi:hypothetical protein
MTGTYLVQDIGNSFTNMENEDKQEEILVGSVEEYNEIENRSLQVSKENPFKGLKLGIWTTTMI